MIVIGGFNTAVDKTLELDALQGGAVNRATAVATYAGGKGLHVACTVAALGEPATLVGPIDAVHRPLFDAALGPRHVTFRGIEVDSVRTCLAIREAGGARVTEILEPGPVLDEATEQALADAFLAEARQSSVAVISGSLPRGFRIETAVRVVRTLRAAGVRTLVDGSGPWLKAAVDARPFLVKPNRDELQALLGSTIDGVDAAAAAALRLCAQGIEMVVVSLGVEGALLAHAGRVCHAIAPAQPAANTVGSGDCLLGGVAVGLSRQLPRDEVLRLGVACGTANTLSPETGYVRREHIDAVRPGVRVSWREVA